jgi:hypothetical protein
MIAGGFRMGRERQTDFVSGLSARIVKVVSVSISAR